MSFSDMLAIIGIVITVILGVAGIYFAIRRTKYPAKITFVREQSVTLLEDFAKKIPNLTLLYKDTPIQKNVILISGYLVNEGSVDITKEMVEQSLRCILPGECAWIEFKVTSTANELQVASSIINKNNVEFQLGLFRCNESFSFQALASLDEKYANEKVDIFTNDISWAHRIASLGDIKTIQMPQQQRNNWFRRSMIWITGLLYFALGIMLVFPNNIVDQYDVEIYNKQSKTILEANIKVIGESFDTKILSNKAGQLEIKKIEQHVKDYKYWLVALGTFGIAILFLFIAVYDEYRRYRIKKLISASSKE